MKNFLLFSLVLLATISIQAQTHTFSLGVVGGPDFYLPQYVNSTAFFVGDKSVVNYSAGLDLRWTIIDRIEIRSGVRYAAKNQVLKYQWQYAGPPDPLVPNKTTIEAGYIDIPLSFGYRVLNKEKIKLVPSLGVLTGVALHRSETTLYDDGDMETTEFLSADSSPLEAAVMAKFGFEYFFIPKVNLLIEPYFRHSLNNLKKRSPFPAQKMSVGGLVGVFYSF